MDLNPTNLHYSSTTDDLLIYSNEEASFQVDESFVAAAGEFGEAEYGVSTEGAEYVERSSILVDGGDTYSVSAVIFDSHEELLWMGNTGGHVTSYYGPECQKYTSFQVHSEEVRCIQTIESGILALTPSALRCQMRRGLPIFTHCSENMVEMQSLLPLKNSDRLLLGGHTNKMIEFDLHQCQELQSFGVSEGGCAILRPHPKFVCCGSPQGRIDLRDPNTLNVEHLIETHTGSLSDFDVHNNLLVTCGFSDQGGELMCDGMLMVWDLRMMRMIEPLALLLDPLLLRFMPSFSSRLTVASPSGQLQFVETAALTEHDMTLYQVSSGGSLVTALDVSTLCQAVCVGDAGGSLHVLTSTPSPTYNPFSRPTEFPDPPDAYQPMLIDDSLAAYSTIPMPTLVDPDEPLFSDWPPQFCLKRYRRMPPIDQEILRTIKMQGTIGYAPNPNMRRRNQIPDWYINGGGPPSLKSGLGSRGKDSDDSNFVAIPKRYRKLDGKFFKLLEDPADIEQFNKTGFSGLEATLPNSYCNAMLQVLYFTEGVLGAVSSHRCSIEFCVTCELGFLFHMLGSSKGGAPCHAGNLLRALRSAKEASALRLILPDSNPTDANYSLLIQSWNRFILHQMHSELLESKRKAKDQVRPFVYKDTDFPSIDPQQQRKRKIKPELTEDLIEDTTKGETEISKIFGSKQSHIFTCLKCSNKSSKEATLLVHNLVYPNIKGESKDFKFSEVLEGSLGGSQVTPAWCDSCRKFQLTLQERQLKSLPQILSINCGNNTESERKFWKEQMDHVVLKVVSGGGDRGGGGKLCRYASSCSRPGCRFKHPHQNNTEGGGPVGPLHLYYSHSWVPSHIRVNLKGQGSVSVEKVHSSELDLPPHNLAADVVQSVVYDLYAVVCFINEEKKNIVGIINVPPSYHTDRVVTSPQWYIFNDVCVTEVSRQEAVWFSMDWKVPCVLYYQQHDMKPSQRPPESPITPSVFSEQTKSVGVTPLALYEIPQPGDIVAMDAEFVTLNQEEAELRSDGKLATIRPSHMSVARISCVRGQGPMEGTPFIDDYISTQEQVFDYLTKFSGIKPGDLDATCSSKNLTTLKSTYLKVRYLIDNGVKFVGHGLNNDFRVINLVVPPDQIIDTVQLFYLPHQRMVSLRFLAWHFLGLKIQAETHDSVEDARTALQLYKKYKELEANGTLQASLEEMYALGKSLQWKIPGQQSTQ